jgi:hypothetical protein
MDNPNNEQPELTNNAVETAEQPVAPKVMVTAPAGGNQSGADERQLRHGRESHVGFRVGQYLQPPPFFFTRDKWPAPFVDEYRGASAFLIASGPSFATVDHSKLRQPGILSMGMNNSAKSFRPNLWTCVDDPGNFLYSVWVDPTIRKIVPISHIDKHLWDSSDGKWQQSEMRVGDCPSAYFYKRNERFKADQFLFEDTVNWGNHKDLGGGRSVLLAALRILFLLGVRRVFMLGVDFEMNDSQKYHFEQDRTASSIRGNNNTYKQLQQRFTQLRPVFEANGYHVFNCNPSSRLTAFDHVAFDEAVRLARGLMPLDVAGEKTAGMYERQALVRAAGERNVTPSPGAKKCHNCSRRNYQQVQAQVNAARNALHEAKDRTAAMERLGAEGSPEYSDEKLKALKNDENAKRKVFRRLVAIREEVTGKK